MNISWSLLKFHFDASVQTISVALVDDFVKGILTEVRVAVGDILAAVADAAVEGPQMPMSDLSVLTLLLLTLWLLLLLQRYLHG